MCRNSGPCVQEQSFVALIPARSFVRFIAEDFRLGRDLSVHCHIYVRFIPS